MRCVRVRAASCGFVCGAMCFRRKVSIGSSGHDSPSGRVTTTINNNKNNNNNKHNQSVARESKPKPSTK
eukprot:4236306-Pyramimonas_sp.AAC.2